MSDNCWGSILIITLSSSNLERETEFNLRVKNFHVFLITFVYLNVVRKYVNPARQ
jgi:hypothetical protein